MYISDQKKENGVGNKEETEKLREEGDEDSVEKKETVTEQTKLNGKCESKAAMNGKACKQVRELHCW